MTDVPDWMIPDPWEIEEDARQVDQRRAKYREYRREYERRPERVAARKEYVARPEVRERLREYHREYQRRRRAAKKALVEGTVVGGLHELYCTGPHRNHKACRVIPVYRGEDAA